jgi:hypothetical protein
MVVNHGVLAVVKTCATEAGIVDFEAERVYQMEPRRGVDAEAHQIAGIGWYLRLMENDAEHVARLLPRPVSLASRLVTSDADALFVPDGRLFVPTELTRTGWVADAQHGGPPCGLLAFAIESVPTDRVMQVARITFDLMRAVPMTPLAVRTEVVRAGRRVQVIVSSLLSDNIEVARATALLIRVGTVPLPESPLEPWEPVTLPDQLPIAEWTRWEHHADLTVFHRDAIEVRTIDESFWTPGRGLSWVRLLHPVVAGEAVTPLVRTATLADVANGNSMTLNPANYLFVNPDVTLYLHREPVGDWLGMESVAHQHETGIGVTDTTLFDTTGPVGHVNQAQLLEHR